MILAHHILAPYNCMIFADDEGKMYGAYFVANDSFEFIQGITMDTLLRELFAKEIKARQRPAVTQEQLVAQLRAAGISVEPKIMEFPPTPMDTKQRPS
jgi:hypothetical protein